MEANEMYNSDWIDLGYGNKIHKTAIIAENVILGKNNIVYPNVIIGLPATNRDFNEKLGKVIIGDNNKFGCNVCVMAGPVQETTVIGNNNITMNYVNIGHNTKIGNDNEIGAGTIIPGWAEIGNNNRIKLNCTFRNRKKMGNNNIVGMSSNVVSDFGDNGLIMGNPAKRIRDVD